VCTGTARQVAAELMRFVAVNDATFLFLLLSKQVVHMTLLSTTACPDKNGEVKIDTIGPLQRHQRKVTLRQCHFPYSQRTVEKAWNRIHFIEDIRITATSRTVSAMLNKKMVNERLEVVATLPLTTNRIMEIASSGSEKILIRTEHPHGFFAPALPEFSKPDARNVVAACASLHPSGAVPLSLVNSAQGVCDIDPKSISFVDEHTVLVDFKAIKGMGIEFSQKECGWLLTPSFSCLGSLADAITIAFNGAVVVQHERDSGVSKMATGSAAIASSYLSSVTGDGLAKSIFGFDGVYAGWETIEIQPGNYYAAKEKGGALPLAYAIEDELNKYVIKRGENTLVFRSPDGNVWKATLPTGNYGSPHRLAKSLEFVMNMTTDKKSKPSSKYSVRFVEESGCGTGNFVFATETAAFDLLLGDQETTLPTELFGFERVDYVGRRSVSGNIVRAPFKKENSNVYSVSVLQGSGRLEICRKTPSPLAAQIVAYANNTLKLRCFHRFSDEEACSGIHPGDLVAFSAMPPPPPPEAQEPNDREGDAESSNNSNVHQPSFDLKSTRKIIGVSVLPPSTEQENDGGGRSDDGDSSIIYVNVPNSAWNYGINKFVSVSSPGSAFSLALFDNSSATMVAGGKHFQNCIGASRLGFDRNGVVSGKDGVITSPGNVNLAPLSVEIHLLEQTLTKSATTMSNKKNEAIIGVLAPSKKHGDAAVFASTTLASNSQTLTVCFLNADGSRYICNGSPVTIVLHYE